MINWRWIVLTLLIGLLTTGCSETNNELPLFKRSLVLQQQSQIDTLLEKASVQQASAPQAQPVKVLKISGTPYEMGFQHGALLKQDIKALYDRVFLRLKLKISTAMLDEIYDLMAPYIPWQEREEMRGLAHGAGIPLRTVHRLHTIPEISEYGQKKRFSSGILSTSCSNLVAFGEATADGELYQLRVLDWMRELGVQRWPVVLVRQPDQGNASVSFSYAGFIGTVSGMNDKGLAFGEKTFGNPPGESLEGIPFVFLFRKLMREADSMEDVEQLIETARRTNAYLYVIGQAGETPAARVFLTDRSSVESYPANHPWRDRSEKDTLFPAFTDLVYTSAREQTVAETLRRYHGNFSPQSLMELTRELALSSNLQNVIFKPRTLEAWISNAGTQSGEAGKASNQGWLHLELAELLRR